MIADVSVKDIVQELSKYKFVIDNEKSVQKQIFDVLVKKWREFNEINREIRLDKNNIIDILFEKIGIEVKIKGSSKRIYYQCERYCNFDQVAELILVTNKPMTLPPEINGKKTTVFNLSNNWL